MTIYMYEDEVLCYDCYIKACDEAEDKGHCEHYNREQDQHYYPIDIGEWHEGLPTKCQGNYCRADLCE